MNAYKEHTQQKETSRKQPVYLDYNASTPCDPAVIAAMVHVLENHYGNPASGTYPQSWYAEELVEIAREQVAALLGSAPSEIIFTSGATESNNLAIKGALAQSGPGARIVSVTTEHRSVLDPLEILARSGFKSELLPVDRAGELSPDTFASALEPRPALVSVMAANNEIGVLHDIGALRSAANRNAALFHTDATQAAGKIPLDVKALGVDLLSLTAHKMYGPKGVGALYVRDGEPRISLRALFDGGGHERGLRSGTLNVPGIVALGKACELARENMADWTSEIRLQTRWFWDTLNQELPGINLNGPPENRLPGNLNFSIEGVPNARLLGLINTKVALSVSSACQSKSKSPSHVLRALGIPESRQHESVRIGIGRFLTRGELEYAMGVLVDAVRRIRAGGPGAG